MKDVEGAKEATGKTCSECGKEMVLKQGRFGEFLACSDHPECKGTQKIDDKTAEKTSAVEAPCEKCGKEMVLKQGRFGEFIACTGYPACRNTRQIVVTAEGKVTSASVELLDELCPRCGKQLARKNGRFGEYVGCSDYPDCKYIKLNEIGVPCPKEGCEGGQTVERRSRRGRTFYGCSNYPDCDFVTWNKLLPQPCPQCKSPYIMEKITKRWGTQHVCPDESCEFKETVVAPLPKK